MKMKVALVSTFCARTEGRAWRARSAWGSSLFLPCRPDGRLSMVSMVGTIPYTW